MSVSVVSGQLSVAKEVNSNQCQLSVLKDLYSVKVSQAKFSLGGFPN